MKTTNKNWQKREQSLDFWNHVNALLIAGELTQLKISQRKAKIERSKKRKKK